MPARCRLPATLIPLILGAMLHPGATQAVTTVFFDSSQATNLVASGSTSDTISTEGYLFTFTRDKLFSGGTGVTNGRAERISWPAGLEAQAVTAGPTTSGARIDIKRQDGQLFAIGSFTAQLLANTYGAGGSWEIMPLLNGEDAVPNPFMYNASGYYGQNFSYNTPELTGFDAYKITLYVDYALMSLTVVDASLPPPQLDLFQVAPDLIELSWPADATGYALESATNLPATFWSPVTNNVVTNGSLATVQVDTAGSLRLFRLRK